MKPRMLFLLLLLTGLSCNRDGSRNELAAPTPTANNSATAQATPAQVSVKEPDEIKYLKGSIGDALDLRMKLVRQGQKLTGSYFYQKIGTRIELKGSIDNTNYLTLEEFDGEGKQTGIFKGLWKINPEEGVLNILGNWTQPDGQKKTAFSLHEEPIYFSGAAEFTDKAIKESNKKLRYEIDANYPQLTGLLSPGFEKFNQEAARLAQKEIREFKKHMSDWDSDNAEASLPESHLDLAYTIALATDDLISVEFDVGTYYRGAAHPNSNAQVLNVDVKNGRTLRLADLFKPGARYLQVLSGFAIKDLKRQSKAQDGVLEESSIETGAGPSLRNYQNWTITKKGLGITFDAYQVGPYVAGPQFVLVPYTNLKEIIRSDGPLDVYLK